MTNLKKFKLDNLLWEDVSLTLKISTYMNSDQIGIILDGVDDARICIDLGSFFTVNDKNYFMVNIDSIFNAEYFITKYKLWTFVDCINLRSRRSPVYEMNLDVLANYDPEGVEKYLWKTAFDELKDE